MSAERPPFPSLIDNTMRSAFIGCGEQFKRHFIQKWVPMAPSIHLHAGGAFAAGLESARRSFYERGNTESVARRDGLQALMEFYGNVEAPITKSGDKSLENVIRAFDSYMERYKLGVDPIRPHIAANGKAMVEFGFTLETQIKHPETGNPILYGGRADMIGEMAGSLWVTDEKTASQLGEQWEKNWALDSQFTGYIVAAQMHGYPVAGALIRGVGLLKTKITHSEAHVHRSPEIIERWWQQLHRDLKRMIASWEEGYWDYALDKKTCNAFGGCGYLILCTSNDPDSYIPIHFRQNTWNPLAKDSGENVKELFAQGAGQQGLAPDLDIPGL